MKKVKQVIIQFDDGSFWGGNLNGFIASFKSHLEEWLKQR